RVDVRAGRRSQFLPALAFARPLHFFAERDGHFALEHPARGLSELERAVSVAVRFQETQCDQLPERRAPLRVAHVRADVPRRELVVAQALHAFGRIAAQYVDEMPGAETLAGAVNAR